MNDWTIGARIRIDPFDPVARRDALLLLTALLKLRTLPTPAMRRRAYRRIPKGFARALHREMNRLIQDIRREPETQQRKSA